MNQPLHDIIDILKLFISGIIIFYIWRNYSLSKKFDEPKEFGDYARLPGEETKPLNANNNSTGS